ncbi:MAG: hypothetical protein ACJ72A_13235 [Nocardioidaceae bacterium]
MVNLSGVRSREIAFMSQVADPSAPPQLSLAHPTIADISGSRLEDVAVQALVYYLGRFDQDAIRAVS